MKKGRDGPVPSRIPSRLLISGTDIISALALVYVRVQDRLTISEVVEVLLDPSKYPVTVINDPRQRPKAGHIHGFSWKDHPSKKGTFVYNFLIDYG